MYKPTSKLLEGIRNGWPVAWYPGDEYFYDMANVDILSGRSDLIAAKTFFIRNAPFGGSHCLLGGLTQALRDIADLPVTDPDYRIGLRELGFGEELGTYLGEHGKLRLQVWAPDEGSAFFPREPVVTVAGPLPDLRIAEGILIQALNFPSLSLTDWERAVRAAYPQTLSDQSYRRSQDHKRASLYAILAGCSGTSNCELRRIFDVPLMGTMGHEWMMSVGDVEEAFDLWLQHRPNKPFLLVDTGDTIHSDFPKALNAVWNNRETVQKANAPFCGPRNDSGNLSYLVVQEYEMFMRHPLAQIEWFKERLRFPLANDLDEQVIMEIKRQILRDAQYQKLDGHDIARRILWGIGTKKGSCVSQPTLGGVAKLVEVEGVAAVKLALNPEGRPDIKTSIPGDNRSCFIRNADGVIKGVLIYRSRDHEIRDSKLVSKSTGEALDKLTVIHPDYGNIRRTFSNYTVEPRQKLQYDSVHGSGFTSDWANPTIETVRERVRSEIAALPEWITDLSSPDIMKVSLTEELFDLRQAMISQGVIREDYLTGNTKAQ